MVMLKSSQSTKSGYLVFTWVAGIYNRRIYRGGSFTNEKADCRSANRNKGNLELAFSNIGFRVAVSYLNRYETSPKVDTD